MTKADFLEVMSKNKEIWPDFAAMPIDAQEYMAKVNMATGTHHAYLEKEKVVGIGGIRHIGIGEAWLVTPPDIRDERKLSLLRIARNSFEMQRDTLDLWRIFATADISETFLTHLGFHKQPNTLVWTRT